MTVPPAPSPAVGGIAQSSYFAGERPAAWVMRILHSPNAETTPLVTFLLRGQGDPRPYLAHCGLVDDEVEICAMGDEQPFALIDTMRDTAASCWRGRYVVLLDADCHPRPGAVRRMVDHFESEPQLGAALFLLDGEEAIDFPNVTGAGAAGFRADALRHLLLRPEALANDVSGVEITCRLMSLGWHVRAFDDLHVARHGPAPSPGEILERRVEQQLEVATRFFPRAWVWPYVREWVQRGRLLAAAEGQKTAYYRGLARGVAAVIRRTQRQPMGDAVFENLVHLEETERRLRRAQDRYRLRSILLLDLGPNLLAFRRAAKQCGIRIVAIADADLAPGRQRRSHRGLRIVGDEQAVEMQFDAAVVCSLWPPHARARREAWRHFDRRPVIDLFEDEALTLLTWHRSVGKLRV